MIIVEQPSAAQIADLQQQTGRYVVGHHIHLLLRKHGFVVHTATETGAPRAFRSLSFVPRGSQYAGAAPAIIEGPVDDAVLAGLGLQADRESTPVAIVEGAKLHANVACYGRFLVKRRIFSEEKFQKQRVELTYSDKLHEPRDVPLQVFRSLKAPWRPLLTASWEGSGGTRVVAVEDGLRAVLGLPLFDLIMATHGLWPDLEAGYSSMKKPSPGTGFEAWLVSQLESMLRRARIMHVRIDRWPNGRSWAFTVRHDYDRLITDAQMGAACDRYESRGVRTNWFFLPHKLIGHQARALQERGHEVALHTTAESHEQFCEQSNSLSNVLGRAVGGVTAHGGRYVGFLGGNQYRWAEDAGMVYSEMLGTASNLPYIGVSARDGKSRPLRIVLMPTNVSLDSGTGPEQHVLDKCLGAMDQQRKAHGCFILMNHPDIHGPEVLRLLDAADLSDAWLPTMPEMAAWCRATHYGARMRYAGERLQLSFDSPVPGATARFFDGREYTIVDWTADESTMTLQKVAANA
jgi:hypothetical protein